MKKDYSDQTRTISSFLVFIVLYWLYLKSILSVFHIFHTSDFLLAMGSHPLDFGWWICSFDNGADSSNLPALESSSSSESLATYRNVIAAENEAEIYQRIRVLENQHYYNIPPQNNQGDYERLVREHFDQAINVDHYLEIFDKEYKEVQILEKKALLQERLQNHEQNIDRIIEMSPYTNVRAEAYHFIQNKVEPVSNLHYAFQRNIMEGSLNSFLQQINQHDRQSDIYREFYRYFTDEEFRRAMGLPLP